MKKIFLLLTLLLCVGQTAFADTVQSEENNIQIQSHNNSQHEKRTQRGLCEVDGIYQFGEFISTDEEQAYFSGSQDTEIIEYIYNGLLRRDEEIYLDIFDKPIYSDELSVYFKTIMNSHPELYYISYMYYYYYYEDDTLASLMPIYLMEDDEILRAQVLIDEEVARACSVVKPGMSNFDKVLAVHDYFVDTYSFDYENLRDDTYADKYSIYGLFVKKAAVCQGYALGFEYVLNRLGIDCTTVQSSEMRHLWNLVKLEDGNWYHIDVTWDDPSQDWYNPENTPTMSDEAYEFCMGTTREYFMLSDKKIKSMNSPHYQYTPSQMATSKKYDEMNIHNTSRHISYKDKNWYYFDDNCNLHSFNATKNTDKLIYENTDKWMYLSSFSDIFAYNDKLYYNTATSIMEYNPQTNKNQILIKDIIDKSSGTALYKLEMQDNTFICSVANDYLGTNLIKLNIGTVPGNIASPNIPPTFNSMNITNATIANNSTTVKLAGDISGIVCAVDFENGRLKAIRTLTAAEIVTFTNFTADEVYVWESLSSMRNLCDKYIISKGR